jgi:RNA polymerase sigma-70 factor, ECF subfamily
MTLTRVPDEAELGTTLDSEVAALTRRLAQLDDGAWLSFHRLYRPRVTRYLLTLNGGNAAAADELAQQTFLRAVRHVREFPNDEVLWSWLTRLARSVVIDDARRRTRWGRFLDRLLLRGQDEPREPAEERPVESRLTTAVATLAQSDQRLLHLRYEARAPLEEIARTCGLTPKAVERRLARLRETLRQLLIEGTP